MCGGMHSSMTEDFTSEYYCCPTVTCAYIFDDFLSRPSHTSHHLIVIYAMGASRSVIEVAYEQRCKEMRSAFGSSEPITENGEEFLGSSCRQKVT